MSTIAEQPTASTAPSSTSTTSNKGGGAPATSSFPSPSSSIQSPSSSSSSSDAQCYQIKYVDFLGRKGVPILLQTENGPCPLLSIANVLLLQGKIHITHSEVMRPNIDLQSLIAIVTEKILETATAYDTDSPELQKQKQVHFD